ncbi:hypothetical protein C1H76_0968 [Elsinoe australis]|uniref:Uncharacterized protein n=1 Tax=Elsinoe australis TaxID=40998 RepID=A0A4U7B5Y4_9PEZI|nr:hypothetical protein C1H76_0968 [Elsinoe australis]
MALPLYLLLLLSYLLLQRLLRFRRRDSHALPFPTRATYSTMTLSQAYEIHYALTAMEFPTVFNQSIFFAPFKTYGIPSISRLLAATTQLSAPATASKRAADTGVLLTEIFLHPPDDPRTVAAFARMNYLHARYRKVGKISDEDMLYTLSLFVLEPVRWTERYEWRALGEVERAALGMYWRWIGEQMRIPFKGLRGAEKGWRDGLDFLEALEEWSTKYEEREMVPAESNATVAKGTVEILLTNVPGWARGAAMEGIRGVMEGRLRRAMLFEDPGWGSQVVLRTVLGIRKWVIGNLFLPRPYVLRWVWFTDRPDENGRYHAMQYTDHPWYVKPTVASRWGISALLLRLVGGQLPGGSDGDKFLPRGYKIDEVGPDAQIGKGAKEMEEEKIRLSADPRLGCPFAAW